MKKDCSCVACRGARRWVTARQYERLINFGSLIDFGSKVLIPVDPRTGEEVSIVSLIAMNYDAIKESAATLREPVVVGFGCR